MSSHSFPPPPGAEPPGGAPPPFWQPPPGWQQPPSWSQQWPGSAGPGGATSEDRMWALLGHLSFFVLGILAPLVIYLVKKDTSPFVRAHAAEALNFHITVTIALIVSAVLMVVLVGFLTFFGVLIAGAVYSVLAAVAANRGEPFRYPLTLRLVS